MKTDDWYKEKLDKCVTISESSKVTYLASTKRLKLLCDNAELHTILFNPKKYGHIIKSKIESEHGQKNIFGLILTYFRCAELKTSNKTLHEQWYNIFNDVQKVINDRVGNHQPTARQQSSYTDWNTIIQIRKKLDIGSIEHVLLSLYTMIDPRRQMDYAQLKVYTDIAENPKEDHNFIHLHSKKYNGPVLCITKHKTSKYYPKYINTDIPIALISSIKKSITNNKREYLFAKKDNTPFMNENSFQKYSNTILKTIFNNTGFSVNTIRHSYLTFIDQKVNIKLIEREKIAKNMGHSLKQSMAYAFHIDNKQPVCYKKENGIIKEIKCPK